MTIGKWSWVAAVLSAGLLGGGRSAAAEVRLLDPDEEAGLDMETGTYDDTELPPFSPKGPFAYPVELARGAGSGLGAPTALTKREKMSELAAEVFNTHGIYLRRISEDDEPAMYDVNLRGTDQWVPGRGPHGKLLVVTRDGDLGALSPRVFEGMSAQDFREWVEPSPTP